MVGVAVGVGLATALSAGYLYKLKLQNSPPKKWRRVGELSELIGYPIKSCGAIRVNQFDCTQLGLKDGEMRDRVFMIVTPESNFITGRSHPKVVQIIPRFVGDKMVLSAPGMSDIDVDVKKLHSITPSRAVVWGETVDAVECGDEVAKWISRFLLDTEFGLRLVFYPNSFPTRDVREKNRIFPTMEKNDSGALHDATSFMLMTEASLEDLNSKLKDKVTALQFRPNFLVKGPEAFEEDNWKWIRIGNKTIFKNCKPCSRYLTRIIYGSKTELQHIFLFQMHFHKH